MNTVSHLIANKRHWNEGDHGTHRIERVLTVSQGASVLDSALLMNQHRVGSLIVVDTFSEVVGIITERDILTQIVAAQRNPIGTRVGDIMTHDVMHCDPTNTLNEVRKIMTDRRIRHLPVIDNGALVGMISIGDLNAASNADLTIEVNAMREYITNG